MSHHYADITFTPGVRAEQERYGVTAQNERLQQHGGPNDQLGSREVGFIAQSDHFYLATVSETGWPYVQHRGGPAGFLKVLSGNQLAYADFRGNLQLVSAGNLSANDRCSLLLMDYANQRRLKLLGRLRVEDARDLSDEELAPYVQASYRGKVERLFRFDLTAFDWNCPQHITPRFTDAEISQRTPDVLK